MKRESSAMQSTTNKADMSWLLNDGDENGPQDTAVSERAAKARTLEEPARAGVHAVHGWLREAPMLYNLALNAGSAASAMSHSSMDSSQPLAATPSLAVPSAVKQCGLDLLHNGRPSGNNIVEQAVQEVSSDRKTDSTETSAESDVSSGEQRRKSWSVSLDETLAIQIYASRPRNAGSKYGSMAEAVRLGEKHGVSPKTIRDIWNRKSWVRVTRAYWTQAEASAYVPRRHRPTSPREAGGGSPKRRPRGGQGKAG